MSVSKRFLRRIPRDEYVTSMVDHDTFFRSMIVFMGILLILTKSRMENIGRLI